LVLNLRRVVRYDAGRVRVAKLVLVSGSTQDCSGGQSASVVALRQSERIAGEIWAGATERLGVHEVTMTYGEAVNFIAAIKLRWAGVGAAPSADGGADYGTRRRIHGDNVSAENAAESRRRSRER
jgi:hypothetical protein